jgi:hypothetical protein
MFFGKIKVSLEKMVFLNFIFKATPSVDTNLEMALALSASLAQAQKKAEEEFLLEAGDPKLIAAKRTEPVPEVLLPEAASWPIGYGKTAHAKNSGSAKTTLQVSGLHFLITIAKSIRLPTG